MSSALQNWSLHHLRPLIEYLDDASLLQIIETAQRLNSPEEVAAHFSGLLGEDHKSVAFISEFNSRRFPPSQTVSVPSRQDPNVASPKQERHGRQQENKAPMRKPVGNTIMSSDLGLKSKPTVKTQKPQAKVKKVDALTEIDAALRDLELNTLSSETKQITCDCAARRHGLNQVSPNCLSCGKIICSVESYTRCSFCHAELLSRTQKDEIIAELRRERGVESTTANNENQKRRATTGSGAKVAYSGKLGANYGAAPVSVTSQLSVSEVEASTESATRRKEELLDHISSGYRRTVIDQASDFNAEATDKWSTPAQRALALRKAQAKLLASEDRGRVISLTLGGGKVKLQNSKREVHENDLDSGIEREQRKIEEEKVTEEQEQEAVNKAYTPNRLMRDLRDQVTQPVLPASTGTTDVGSEWWRKGQRNGWRRVQDFDDSDEEAEERNEQVVIQSSAMDGQSGRVEELGTSRRG